MRNDIVYVVPSSKVPPIRAHQVSSCKGFAEHSVTTILQWASQTAVAFGTTGPWLRWGTSMTAGLKRCRTKSQGYPSARPRSPMYLVNSYPGWYIRTFAQSACWLLLRCPIARPAACLHFAILEQRYSVSPPSPHQVTSEQVTPLAVTHDDGNVTSPTQH